MIRTPFDDATTHCASIEVAVPAETAFAFMADGMKQNHWALGSVNRRNLGGNLYVGISSFDGSEQYVRVVAHPDVFMVDYFVGPSRDDLRPMVEARIRDGSVLGRSPASSVITLTTWRSPDATDAEWEMRYHLWKTEVYLIRGAIERGL